jgi:hypothetical protein
MLLMVVIQCTVLKKWNTTFLSHSKGKNFFLLASCKDEED